MSGTNKLLKSVFYLALCGVLISIYLTYSHYSDTPDPFCNIGDFANCDKVNKSIYAELFGIPVAILGTFAYSFIAFITRLEIKKFDFTTIYKKLEPKIINKLLLLFVIFSFAFALSLTYIEFFILDSICIFCVFQQFIIFIILILLVLVVKNKKLKEVID